MKEASKVVMGATLVMVVSLALVLALILVLLAELYCSLLLRTRRQLRNSAATSAMPTTNNTFSSTSAANASPGGNLEQSARPLSSFCSQGVLQAPRNFLFPQISCQANRFHHPQRNQNLSFLHLQVKESSPSPRGIDWPSSVESPSTSVEIEIQLSPSSCSDKEHFVYISNPIYDNDGARKVGATDTPFETPDTSPSRLESGGSSSGDEENLLNSPVSTPPLTPMKKLPVQACSVSLRDARSLDTSGTDSNSNNVDSSSSFVSPPLLLRGSGNFVSIGFISMVGGWSFC